MLTIVGATFLPIFCKANMHFDLISARRKKGVFKFATGSVAFN
jgi:hypothetical protein